MATAQAAQPRDRTFHLSAYIRRREDGRYVATCLRPYLVTEGRTLGEAKQQMLQLIEGYVNDAAQDGTLDVMMARRAPLAKYREYVLSRFVHHISDSLKPFKTTCCAPQHA